MFGSPVGRYRDFKKLDIDKYLNEKEGGEKKRNVALTGSVEHKDADRLNGRVSTDSTNYSKKQRTVGVEKWPRNDESFSEKSIKGFLYSLFARRLKIGSVTFKIWVLIFIFLFSLALIVIGVLIGYLISPRIVVLAARNAIGQEAKVEYEGLVTFGPTPVLLEYPLNARGMIVIDRSNGSKLAFWHENDRLPIASLTKLVTAFVALQYWNGDEYIVVTQEVDPSLESSAGLKAGDSYRVEDLIAALLISSANEAGYTLADNYYGGRKKFVEEMNRWVSSVGLNNTHLVDPVGVSSENVSTASELATITRLVLENNKINALVGKKSLEISSSKGKKVELSSTNELLESGNFYGVKTGITLDAGPCLIGWYKDNSNDMIIVLLNASKRFDTVKNLANMLKR